MDKIFGTWEALCVGCWTLTLSRQSSQGWKYCSCDSIITVFIITNDSVDCIYEVINVPADALVASATRLCFYQTRSAWSMDQGSNKNHSPINNFTPTVTKFCVMWDGQALPHDTKFRNCTGEIVDSRAFSSWSLIHGSSWSGLIKAEPGHQQVH